MYEVIIHLEKRFSSCTNDERMGMTRFRGPLSVDCRSEFLSAIEPPPTRAIGSDEVRVAELTRCLSAITLQACPEVATGKAAEDCRPARVGALALKGIEDLLYYVGHDGAMTSDW
jgi:hypothetical protein